MRIYTFELETVGKCEVMVEAENDQEATQKFFNKEIIGKNQVESNLEWPNTNANNHSELMDYCMGWDNMTVKAKTPEELAEEKLRVDPRPEVIVEKPLVVPEEGFKINLNGKTVRVHTLDMCFQDLIIQALGGYKNGEAYTVTYKHTQRHTDLGFKLEGSIKNNENLKMNDGLVVNIQII